MTTKEKLELLYAMKDYVTFYKNKNTKEKQKTKVLVLKKKYYNRELTVGYNAN